jgi:hypothetical protein
MIISFFTIAHFSETKDKKTPCFFSIIEKAATNSAIPSKYDRYHLSGQIDNIPFF